VPYLAIIDTRLTPGVQTGFYIGYLFKADGSGVYLSLNQGTTETEEDIQLTKNRLRYDVPGLANWGEFDIDLVANKKLGRSLQKANLVARYYAANNLPGEAVLQKDLQDLMDLYQQARDFKVGKTRGSVEHGDSVTVDLPKPFI
jgi:hypothetical protein